MKKAILLFAITTIAFSCKKKEDNPTPATQTPTPTVQPTTVEIRVVDEIGNAMPSLPIKLQTQNGFAVFSGDTTYLYNTFANGNTNSSGVYKTSVDANIKLYYAIEGGECLKQSSTTFSGNTTPNVNNVVTVIMKKKIVAKTLTIRNTTSTTQITYLDGVKLKDLAGYESTTVSTLSGETYTVKFVFKDMPEITPWTETIKIECDKNNIVTF